MDWVTCAEVMLLLVLGALFVVVWIWVRRGRRPRSRPMRLGIAAAVLLVPAVWIGVWDPGPATENRFDKGHNGLWIGSKWYTGRDERSGSAVPRAAVEELLQTLEQNGIRYAYVRAGRITSAGSIPSLPQPLFYELQARAPDVRFLPWLSADADEIPLADGGWRSHVLQALAGLYARGVEGVHLNIEPLRDDHPGYCELLQEIRHQFDGEFFVSHASRRVVPFGVGGGLLGGSFWSDAFYRKTMAASDQTVLMGYNTLLGSPKLYVAYMRQQTEFLLDWASGLRDHQVLIGIPAYEGLSELSDPEVENVANAVAGVRAALERYPRPPACFEGVAIYASWLTDSAEWRQFQEAWLHR